MDLNRLTRDADDLIRKVVSRYNQLYVPEGNISQVELDLMLDDLRKLYDTFKTIGQANIALQSKHNKPEVAVNTHAEAQTKPAATSMHDTKPPKAQEPAAPTVAQPEPETVMGTEPQTEPEVETKAEAEAEVITEPIAAKEPEVTEETETFTEPEPETITEIAEEIKPEFNTNPEPEPQEVTKSPLAEMTEEREEEKTVVPVKEKPDFSIKPETNSAMLADKFNSSSKSLSEKISEGPDKEVVGSRLRFQPIADLTTGIAINDKFSIISELFGNNAVQYEEAITRINKAVNHDEASWILQKYHNQEWDNNTESLARFKEFVKRRFI